MISYLSEMQGHLHILQCRFHSFHSSVSCILYSTWEACNSTDLGLIFISLQHKNHNLILRWTSQSPHSCVYRLFISSDINSGQTTPIAFSPVIKIRKKSMHRLFLSWTQSLYVWQKMSRLNDYLQQKSSNSSDSFVQYVTFQIYLNCCLQINWQ